MQTDHQNNVMFLDAAMLRGAMSPDYVFEDLVYLAACHYVEMGIPVLPLTPGSKMLPTEGGISYASATSRKSTIDGWFGAKGKYRGYNIGIGCGVEGGVMALDIDAKIVPGTNTTGMKELAKIIEKHGGLPPGPCQSTPSGGNHYLYKWESNATSSSSKVAPGIDTRGGTSNKCTGHIVAFPSIIKGKMYEWIFGGEVPLMPDWLVAALGSSWEDKSPKKSQNRQEDEKVEIPIHQVNRMLAQLSPDDVTYEDWVKVGMVLKYLYGEDGLEIWDEWSKYGARRKEGECKSRWRSFGDEVVEGCVGFGTLLYLAKDAGWRPLPGDVTGGQDAEIEERVLQMNNRYALMRMGKNTLIATFEKNANGTRVGFLNTGSFEIMMKNEPIFIKNKKYSMSDVWLSSPLRREYYDMGIYPQDKEPEGTLNMWNGWGVVPDPDASCEKYLKHVEGVICDGNTSNAIWLLDWMADCVQDFRNVKGTCVVLKGIEGCGKGIWADNFGLLFGKHYTHIVDAERLTSRFNSFMADSILVFADEVLFPGDRKSGNVLKGLISERIITREAKGVDSVDVDNLNRVIIASNEDWIIPAGPQSRRYFVLNVSSVLACNKPYFDSLAHEMDNGGREALLHFLLNRKITSNLRTAPVTGALIEQRKMSSRHDTLMQWLMEVVEKGGFNSLDSSAMVGESGNWPVSLNKYEVYSEYREWAKETRASTFDVLTMPVFLAKVVQYGFSEKGRDLSIPPKEALGSSIGVAQGVV